MPLYEYQCHDCDEVFFELRKSSEREDPIACPTCDGEGFVMISQFAQGGADGDVSHRPCNTGST